MRNIAVEAPGLFTTVQDLGRPGFGPIGVSASGAADSVALRVGNLLLGNPPNAAALEMTLQGGKFLFAQGAHVALTGSDFFAVLEGSAISPWIPVHIPPGKTLDVSRTQSGARAYLCVRGGIDVPRILGSSSTHVLSGLGGWEGRALRKGDVLGLGPEPSTPPKRGVRPEIVDQLQTREVLRATDGPQRDWFPESSLAAFYGAPYTVTPDANRMGLRLQGPSLEPRDSRELITEGVPLGCVQVPASGQPVILFVEQQTTGGYPKIANVISADLSRVGQLKPGDRVRFERVNLQDARELLFSQERWIASEESYL